MTFFRLTVKETLSELSFSNALKFWCGFLYKFRSTIENQHGRLVGDPLSFEIPMDISLETSCWRTPYFHLRPQNSRWRLQYFHWRPPYFFGGHPILSSETQIFSWENPRFSSYLQRKFGVSNSTPMMMIISQTLNREWNFHEKRHDMESLVNFFVAPLMYINLSTIQNSAKSFIFNLEQLQSLKDLNFVLVLAYWITFLKI